MCYAWVWRAGCHAKAAPGTARRVLPAPLPSPSALRARTCALLLPQRTMQLGVAAAGGPCVATAQPRPSVLSRCPQAVATHERSQGAEAEASVAQEPTHAVMTGAQPSRGSSPSLWRALFTEICRSTAKMVGGWNACVRHCLRSLWGIPGVAERH